MRRLRRWGPIVVVCVPLLSGCDWIDSILPDNKPPPLPGERISVMVVERDLEPDQQIADLRVMLPRPYVNASWPQSGGSPGHAMHHLKIAELPKEAWSTSIGKGSKDGRQLLSPPIVVGDRVYVMDIDFKVSAIDVKTGDRVWRYEAKIPEEDEETFGGGLAFDSGKLFVTTGFGKVFALNAANGKLLWEQEMSGPLRAAPTVSAGRLYVVTIDNQLTVLDSANGEKKWSHNAITETAGLLGGSSPAVNGSTVAVPYSSGELFAIRVENGRVVWSDNLMAIRRVDTMSSLAHIRGNPVMDRGMVFAISHSGRLVAIDQRSGARLWERNIGGVDTPWVAGDFIFVLSNENDLFCLTRRGGRVRWVQPLPRFENAEKKKDPIRWSGPILVGNRLIVAGSHGELMSLSPYTGKPMGMIEVPDGIMMAPVVAGETIFVLTDDADLIAYR